VKEELLARGGSRGVSRCRGLGNGEDASEVEITISRPIILAGRGDDLGMDRRGRNKNSLEGWGVLGHRSAGSYKTDNFAGCKSSLLGRWSGRREVHFCGTKRGGGKSVS